MQGETAERWRTLCEQAAKEQDPKKLMDLISEITRLLNEKELRLLKLRAGSDQLDSD
ncbi:MAG TPA: hypothetical protein VFA90_00115 [Terriglobales bacterium]|nr:hypothetical protein [Terriglobales bacterium]